MHVLTRVVVLAGVLSFAGAAFAASGADSAGAKASSEPRKSLYTTGIAVGYLIPVSGTYSYTRATSDLLGSSYATESPAAILNLSSVNIWRFDHLLLETDGSLGLLEDRFILGADLTLNYAFGTGMMIPFAGGGVGVRHGPVDDGPGNKLNTGPALSAQAGLLLFGGYDVNVLIRGKYVHTLTGDMDRGFVADAGVVYAFQARDRDPGR
jgi:hypothetical protein